MRNKFATLRAKTIGIIVVTTVGILVLLYVPLRLILLESFITLEEQSVIRDVQRILNQITNSVEDLNMTAVDYAGWDDTYAYMETLDQTYIGSNYVEPTYFDNQLNVIMLIDTSGEIVYADAYDFNAETYIPIPDKFLTLAADDPLLTPMDTERSVAGIMMIAEDQPMFVASQPILTSKSEGPARGVLIMGRLLDAYEVARLTETTQLSVMFTDITAPTLNQELQNIRARLMSKGTKTEVVPLNEQAIAGYAIVSDIYDNPALLLRVEVGREIYAQGKTLLLYLGIALLAAGLAFGIVMWQLLGRFVITRLGNFRTEVAHIGVLGSEGDFSSRVPVQGKDELSQFGSTINAMLDKLERYQKELLIQKQRFEDLVAVARATVEQPDLDTTLKNAVEAARTLTRAERGSVFIFDELGAVTYSVLARENVTTVERQELVTQVMNVGLAGWVSRHRQAALVADTDKDLRWFPLPNIPYEVRSALVIPIFSGTRKLGILTLTHPEVNHFNQDDLELMQAAADQMALAMRNAQIYDDQRRLAERQTALYETLRTISTLLDPETVIQVAVDKIADITKWPAVTILLPDKKTELLVLHARAGYLPLPEEWHSAINFGTIGRAFGARETLYIDNTRTHTSSVTLYDKAGSQIVAPLRYGQRTLGILNIEHENIYGFRADDIILAESLTDAIALALENANIHSHIRQYAANLNMLYSLAQVTSRSPVLEAMLPAALISILESLGFDAGFIGLFDPEGAQLQLATTQGIASDIEEELQAILNKEIVRNYLYTQHLPMLIEDLNRKTPQIARLEAAAPQIVKYLRHWEIQAFISAPLVQQGRALGVIGMLSTQTRVFSSDDQALQVTLIQQLATAITNARLFQAITDERSRLQALIESSRDGIIFIDANQRVPVINAAALKLLDLTASPQQWNDRTTFDFLSTLRHHAAEAARVLLAELRRVQRDDEGPAEGEFEVSPRTIHWFNLPVTAEDTPLGRLIVLHDVTEEHLLKRMREDLTRTTVHDLRNPLTSISGALELLDTAIHHTLGDEQQQLLEIANRATRRMLNLVNAILDVNRLESGQMPLQYTIINLRDFVDEVIQGQMPLAITKALHMENALPSALPPINADRGLLERVFQNLIGNAIKFTPSDGTVRVTGRQEMKTPSTLYISVSDNGPGIPPEIQGRLFEKFTTGKHIERGTGLGLAFCKMVLNAHNEDIWVESTGEQGTTFTFTLSSL